MWIFIIIMIAPVFSFSQTLEFEPQGIPVEVEGRLLPIPWTGGISYSKPEFVDIDSDGDYDCFVGDSEGKLWYFENTGTNIEPEWEFVTDFYDSIKLNNKSCPIFCDIDSDSDFDLFVAGSSLPGIYPNNIIYYNNIGDISNPIFELVNDSLASIYWCWGFDFGDIDNDGDYDLVQGWTGGNISLWENVGNSYLFNYINDTLILVTNNFNKPAFGDLDNDGDLDIVYGLESGQVNYLRNDGTPQQYNFTVVTQNLVSPPGPDAAPALVDIDGDGDLDLFVGTGDAGWFTPYGGIRYYENTGTAQQYNFVLRTDNYLDIDCGTWSVSRLIDIDDDGDEDLFIGYANGSIAFYRNTGTPDSAYFVLESECFQNLNGGGKCAPAFVDIDVDGDYDLFTGYSPGLTGAVKLFENVGTPTNPSFVLRDDQYFYCDFGNVYPAVFDYDLDGDYDVVLGTQEGLIYYENIGTPQAPNYDFVTQNFFNINGGIPYFYDIDHDNYPELFKGVLDSIYYYDSNNFIFTLVSTNWEQTAAHYWYAAPCLADIDNDGDGDLFVGSEGGGVTFWRNLYDSSAVHSNLFLSPTALTLHPCYPNPFNNETILPLELPERSNIRIDLYNIKGQLITTCYQGIENAGVVKIRVKGDDLASGVYFIKMTAEGLEKGTKFSDVGKILMLK